MNPAKARALLEAAEPHLWAARTAGGRWGVRGDHEDADWRPVDRLARAAPDLARAYLASEERCAALEAERDELRLTLLAEQGDPAGAPSEGWNWHRLAGEWRQTTGGFVGRHQAGVWWWVIDGATGTAPTAREAMAAADAAAEGEQG